MPAKILLPRTSLKLYNSLRVSAFQHRTITRFNNRSKISTDGCNNHNAPRQIINLVLLHVSYVQIYIPHSNCNRCSIRSILRNAEKGCINSRKCITLQKCIQSVSTFSRWAKVLDNFTCGEERQARGLR